MGGGGGGGFGPACFDFSGLDVHSGARDYRCSAQPRKLGDISSILSGKVWPEMGQGWLPELWERKVVLPLHQQAKSELSDHFSLGIQSIWCY